MPTYEYRCTQCEHIFECVQHMGDPAPDCPRCGSPTRKVFSSVGLIFKGKGFHTTDYRKPARAENGDAKPAPKDTAAKEASTTSTDASSSTKDSTPSKGDASSASSASDS